MSLGRRRETGTRWDEDNRLVTNPWPFVVFAVGAAALVGLGALFWIF